MDLRNMSDTSLEQIWIRLDQDLIIAKQIIPTPSYLCEQLL